MKMKNLLYAGLIAVFALTGCAGQAPPLPLRPRLPNPGCVHCKIKQ